LSAAGNAYAFGLYTASVFHSMRACEKGLHALARILQVQMKFPIELENWKNIIDHIEKEIGKLDQAMTKGALKDETLQFYSEAAKQFSYFKDAWRNHVSHSRSSYDESQSLKVLGHVKDFFETLSRRLVE
jgi:hypothetical protein